MIHITTKLSFLFKMLPELLYEIYKYVAPEQYLKLNEVAILKHLVDTFRDPLEGKYIYFYGEESIKGLNHGLKYIALTNPTYWWVDKYGIRWRLIQYASRYGYLEVVKLLLENERVDPSNNNNNCAIRYASQYGYLEVAKLLLEDERVDPSSNNNCAIRYASGNGHLEVVKLFLEDERVDPTVFDNEAIRYASSHGRLEVVKLLLEDERVDPSANRNGAIRWASQWGHLRVVKLLLEDERVDPSDVGNDAIRRASSFRQWEVVKLLLEDKRVQQSLTYTDIEKYLKQINYKNELNYHLITIPIQKCYPNCCTKSTNIYHRNSI